MKYGTPTDEQLAKINRMTKRPFKAEEVYTFKAKMIGDALIPGRYIKLDKSLLEEYDKDGQDGNVAYMLNHRWTAWLGLSYQKGVINLGRVYDSWLEEAHDLPDESVAQYGMVYIPRDREKDGVNTNEVIESIEDGTLRDVSVGIGWTRSECSICGNDIRSSDCEHRLGKTYEEGGLCYIVAKPPGDEFELSGVFAGAYPTAEAMSAGGGDREANEEGSMQVLAVEDIKSVPEGAQVFAAFSDDNVTLFVRKGALKQGASFSIGSETNQKGGEEVEDEKEQENPENKEGTSLAEAMSSAGLSESDMLKVVDALTQASAQFEKTPSEIVASLENVTPKAMEFANVLVESGGIGMAFDSKKVVEVLGKEMDADSILSLAREGQVLKAELVDDTLEWGVRALGNGFAREFYAQTLAEPGRTIDGIKSLREQFKAQTKEALATGRKTKPESAKEKTEKGIPDEAFKA